MASATSSWRKMRRRNTLGRVGEFFEAMVASALEGETNGYEYQEFADVINTDIGLAVEVKSRDHERFGINIRQLDTHYQVHSPFIRFVYGLCVYKGRQVLRKEEKRPRGVKGRVVSLLARHSSKHEQFQVLANRVDEVYLICIEVIQAMRSELGTQVGGFAGREEEEHLLFGRKELRQFRDQPSKRLVELGLDPSEWICERFDVDTTFVIDDRRYGVKVPFYTVLAPDVHQKVKLVLENRLPF